MNASDADRDRAIRDLTRHCGDGRLTLDELEDRVAEAYAATTSEELLHALRDLPKEPAATTRPAPRPVSPPATTGENRLDQRRAGEIALHIHMVVYLSVMALLVAIWFLTSPFGYFWPIWTAMPWGMALAIHAGAHRAVWRDR